MSNEMAETNFQGDDYYLPDHSIQYTNNLSNV